MRRTRWFLTGLLLATALAITPLFIPTDSGTLAWGQTNPNIPGSYAGRLQNNTSSASSNGTVLSLFAQVPTVFIQATGTFSGATFTIQGSADNVTYVNVECMSSDQRLSYTQNGWLSATGLYFCNTIGVNYLQATVNSGTPGGVTIAAQGSTTYLSNSRQATGPCVLQAATSSTGTGTPCANNGYNFAIIQFGGTLGTLTAQGTVDGTNWINLACIDQPSFGSRVIVTAAGVIYCEAVGFTQVRTNITVAGTLITAQATFSNGNLASSF